MPHQVTPQLDLWRGDFGDKYISRNAPDEASIKVLTRMWATILRPLHVHPKKILEVGSNVGLNLRALRRITQSELFAVEPNAMARKRMIDDGVLPDSNIVEAFAASLPFDDASIDFVFTSGVLIHIGPADLLSSCKEIQRVSSKYVMCCEYYSDCEEEIPYRGHQGQMFRRDYGQFYLDNFPDLTLVDYGFFWKGAGCLDNLTWWLLKKAT